MPDPDFHWTASSAAAAVSAASVSATELLERCLERIDRFNPRLNVLVTVDVPATRKAALDVEGRLAAGERLPLLGVPISFKDSFATRGCVPPPATGRWSIM